MILTTSDAMAAGYERVSAWSDLLDAINVFPVADADTGRNLKISLAPMRSAHLAPAAVRLQLLEAAVGNSGNIAAAFFSELLKADSDEMLTRQTQSACEKARMAVADPKPGTMLSVFETLARFWSGTSSISDLSALQALMAELEATVKKSPADLPELAAAGVVDAGALGMYLFWEGVLDRQTDGRLNRPPVTRLFGSALAPKRMDNGSGADGYCINTLLTSDRSPDEITRRLDGVADSLVAVAENHQIKLHFHTASRREVRNAIDALGQPIQWREEPLTSAAGRLAAVGAMTSVHLMTDAAGSLTRDDARDLGVTLLDSYIIMEDRSYPETLVEPEILYQAMRSGIRVSTAQASLNEKRACYQSVTSRFDHTLYLCVGAAYTGNYTTAGEWRRSNTAGDRLTVIDSTAASGRLGLLAQTIARFAAGGGGSATVAAFAKSAIAVCDELVFLDQLKYLAAGGRISKTSGFFGDLFSVKPVIRPTADGVKKAGTVRRSADQVTFACDYLKNRLPAGGPGAILLQFSDNEQRVRNDIEPLLKRTFPAAKMMVRPLSLTSGAHMGPGTWALAFMPPINALEVNGTS
jgi:DegV family protein with EDD domain